LKLNGTDALSSIPGASTISASYSLEVEDVYQETLVQLNYIQQLKNESAFLESYNSHHEILSINSEIIYVKTSGTDVIPKLRR
jgi:hypothetical protein